MYICKFWTEIEKGKKINLKTKINKKPSENNKQPQKPQIKTSQLILARA